ncbi:hypothetical protein [Lichenibacterium dinghuense]|uniref:hypothetical protein n=1 Tax=Lichenibacterium dinghuense TaxID=2895977 RepID=UPI001F38E2A6|nr:hypothetical protein [Lichenibacterium sp. 6Y81]
MDWFYNDDLATLRWFAEADAGRLRPWDLPDLWNNEHPVGAQFALLWLARRALGLDMRAFVGLSVVVVALTAAMAARLAADARDPVAIRCAAVAACFALAFQPTQTEHLLWSFELGWFVVNAVVVADAVMTERFGPRAVWPAAALCAAASLASAQGAFAFFAAALHQALMPARPGRRTAAAGLALGGVLVVAHLLWRPHASASAAARPDHAFGGMVVYAVEVLGGQFGLRGRLPLLLAGSALLAAAVVLLWRRRRTLRPDRLRCALVLMGFSGLCLAAFAQGRHHLGLDWATASFHAAPLLVPFALGLAVLLGAPPAAAPTRRRLDRAASAATVLLLASATAAAVPYGVTRARLWAMDRGYARWATCSGAVPELVAARGSGVDYDLAGFALVRPLATQMCAAPAGPLEAALVRRPPLFDALAAGRPEVDRALDALWQDYATDPKLQLAFKPWRSDTPVRLLAFAEAEKGSEIEPGRLTRDADIHRGPAP